MELKNFIQEAVKDIASGLQSGSTEMIENGIGNGIPDSQQISVTFDIAITITNNDSKEGGGKISVLGPYLEFAKKSKNTNEVQYVSRLTFVVPIFIKTLEMSKYSI